jgi:hypothetical protein
MSRMRIRSARASQRFLWSVFRGRCRRNLLAGLALFILGGMYGTWGAGRLAARGADAHAFDRPLVRLAQSMVRQPANVRRMQAMNIREFYLLTVISDQHDVLEGLTIFLLRLVISLTAAGFGLVLMTAGATEWEIRSEVDSGPRPAESPAAARAPRSV